MNREDLPRCLMALVAMAEAFGQEMGQERQDIYCRALEDLPIETVEAAIWRVIKTRTFAGNLPTVAEIREAAGGNQENLDDQAQIAWSKVSWAIDRCGWDASIAFDDPLIMHVIRLWGGSWGQLRRLDWRLSEVKWRQKEFIGLYHTVARQAHLPEPPKYFIGETEAYNERMGFLDNPIPGTEHLLPAPILITGEVGAWQAIEGPAPRVLPEYVKPGSQKLIEGADQSMKG